jgi:hypothetical protein
VEPNASLDAAAGAIVDLAANNALVNSPGHGELTYAQHVMWQGCDGVPMDFLGNEVDVVEPASASRRRRGH